MTDLIQTHDAIRATVAGSDDYRVVYKDNRAYDEAAALAKKIGALMQRAGQAKEFGEWIAALREKHKAKRNLMQRVDELV